MQDFWRSFHWLSDQADLELYCCNADCLYDIHPSKSRVTFLCFFFLLFYKMDKEVQKDPVIEEEVKYRYNSVIVHYRKSFIQDNAQR